MIVCDQKLNYVLQLMTCTTPMSSLSLQTHIFIILLTSLHLQSHNPLKMRTDECYTTLYWLLTFGCKLSPSDAPLLVSSMFALATLLLGPDN